jgi:hypothetical protein
MKDFFPFIIGPLVALVVYTYLKNNNKCNRLKKSSLLIFLLAFIITEVGRSFYRPYIYSEEIRDFFIADTIGNSLGTIATIFFILTIIGKGSQKDVFIILYVVVGLILYEGFNILSNYPVDIKDIICILIFGLISLLIYWVLLKRQARYKNNC